MIKKTDKFLKRRARVWERRSAIDDMVPEYVRRETWWLFWLIPLYQRDTVIDKVR